MSDVTETETVEEEATPEVESETTETEVEQDGTENGFDPDKAREKIRKVNSENRSLRQRAKEAEDKAAAAEDTGKRVTVLEAENMRLKVAVKLGGQLPDDLIERLRGDTEEELLEDAEKLLGYFEKKQPPTNQPREKLRGGGDPTQTTSHDLDDLDKFSEDIFKN